MPENTGKDRIKLLAELGNELYALIRKTTKTPAEMILVIGSIQMCLNLDLARCQAELKEDKKNES